MSGVDISIRSNIKEVSKKLTALAHKQIDYATTLALNSLAKRVQIAEQGQIKATFKHPKPFTVNAVGMRGATKQTLTAIVFIRPVAAKYLAPYEDGGSHVLPGRALLNPKNIRLDQYGQLTRATLKRLKAMPNVFIGPVKTAHGTVNGVWQRIKASRGKPAHLKLLIRFGDALPVNKRLQFGSTGKKVIERGFVQAFTDGMAKAMATAK
ncbi:hypothetical protein B0E46_15780 [Rhodanobacter sp. B04]|uniref:hypothetical protein n=1 Tax=Rhodanobacter sp. B04 TaxID=1945860 RepID=UPI0009845A7D|nr:hypothetical protein [Rhodanobacter sp. B04]OOG61436.1 hypothetical protein B0E46_15780 [Rhodanobacter sp. B04]